MHELEVQTGAALGRWLPETAEPIALAVSGGSDSLALLHLVRAWSCQSGRPVFVLTVDHGLRPEAAGEAAFVERICLDAGIPHQTLVWTDAPEKASPAKARRVRHALLAEAARAGSARYLLLAHTEDDQAETILMRERSAEGHLGSAGMRRCAVSPVWPEGRGLLLLRPCLGRSRRALQDYLRALGQDWVRDPTNDDPAFERVRVRAELQADPALKAVCLATGQALGGLRRARDLRIAHWLAEHVRHGPDGLITCDLEALGREDAGEALAFLVMAAAGSERRPAAASREALADHLTGDSRHEARTLGGAWAAVRQGRVHIARDPGEAAKTPAFGADFQGVWDGRFEISRPGQGETVQVGAEACPPRPMALPGLPPLCPGQAFRSLVPDRIATLQAALVSDANAG